MTIETQNEEDLKRLVKLLRTDYWTARKLATRTKAAKPSVYRRIRQLEAYYHISVKLVREGVSGPPSKAYKIVGKK